ncbi:MAG: hypothetical protein RIM84_17275 [Alphaproteobacteria bacterium]
MKGLARTSRIEKPAPSTLPNVAVGGRVRVIGGRPANDNRVSMYRRAFAPMVFLAGLLLLFLALL